MPDAKTLVLNEIAATRAFADLIASVGLL
jgi:hypothetical protein